MTHFYAYFALSGTTTVPVGAVSEAHALRYAPEPFELLRRIAADAGDAPVVRDAEAELVNLLPSWQAEEHARDITELVLAGPAADDAPAPRPRGVQRLFDLDVRLSVRAGYVISAPTSELARRRADEALRDTARIGFAALDPDAVPFARVEALRARPWSPVRPQAAEAVA